MIIKIEAYENNAHDNDSRTPEVIPEGYIKVPKELEEKAWKCLPFINLDIVDGVLVDVSKGEEIKIGPDILPKKVMSVDALTDVVQGIIPFTLQSCARSEKNSELTMRSLAQSIAPISSILPTKEWVVGMTTEPGDIVSDPLGKYRYIFSGKDPMTHSNPLFYPGAQGVYYWKIIPNTKSDVKIYPDVDGIIVSVKRGENWYDANGENLYQWVAEDNDNCVWPPNEENENTGLWYKLY